MLVKDFIAKTRDDLQEKSEQWSNPSLLLKLQESYTDLQFDLPYFIANEKIAIKKGISTYHINNVFLKDISFKISNSTYTYTDMENLFINNDGTNLYSYQAREIFVNVEQPKDAEATLIYKYQKDIKNVNCYIEIPTNWYKCLRYLFLSKIHEKPTRNTKERDLSKHYLNLYNIEVNKLQTRQKARAKNIQTKYIKA